MCVCAGAAGGEPDPGAAGPHPAAVLIVCLCAGSAGREPDPGAAGPHPAEGQDGAAQAAGQGQAAEQTTTHQGM